MISNGTKMMQSVLKTQSLVISTFTKLSSLSLLTMGLAACSPAEFQIVQGAAGAQKFSTPTSGGTAGTNAGSTAGSTSGSTAGSTSGSTAGSTSGSTAGSTSGSTAGSTSGSTAGSTSGSTGGVVCDPFDPGTIPSGVNGLKGDLYYLRADQPQYGAVQQYIDNGVRANVDVFFRRIMIPTRMWDTGFVTEYGTSVRNDSNQLLTEWFALDLRSQLKLRAQDPSGDYQLALLTDDGAILDVATPAGPLATIVNNDGAHPTRLACSSSYLRIERNDRIPMRLRYYQGPRTHIAAVMLWRPINSASVVPEFNCGLEGNERYFDPSRVPSEPTSVYSEMLSRGWRPLESDNFELESGVNPCVSRVVHP